LDQEHESGMIEVSAESSISLFSHKKCIISTEIFDNLTCSIIQIENEPFLCLEVLMNMTLSAKIGILKAIKEGLQLFHIGEVRGLL
jgi:hypothetical protein